MKMENHLSEKPFLQVSHEVGPIYEVRQTAEKYYKPWILRPVALTILLLINLALIGLSEYAFHVLPHADTLGLIEEAVETELNITKRQVPPGEEYLSTIVTKVQGAVKTLVVTYEDPCASLGPTAVCAPPPQYWLAVGTVTIGPTAPPTPVPVPAPGPSDLVYVFTNAEYFVGAFLPTLLAVMLAIPWAIIDAKARRLEPFHQLAKVQGARASSTLFIDYLSPFSFAAPVRSLLLGHWTPFMTSVLSISTMIITPLAPEFVSIRMEGSCDAQTTGCVPSLSIFPIVGRLIEAMLCVMVILTVLLLLHTRDYSTGVHAEPFSIAGLASLFHHPEVKADFRDALINGPEKNSNKSLQRVLGKRRYRLGFYTGQDGSLNYGLAPLHLSASSEAIQERQQYSNQHTNGQCQSLPTIHPHWKVASGLIIVLSGLLVIIVYYKSISANTGFENFMDSQGFGVRFLFTLIGVIITQCWSSIFRDISSLDAFHQLGNRLAKAQDSILISHDSNPLTSILSTLRRGGLHVTVVSTNAFLAEALTICLSNTHFNVATTYRAFTVSVWLSCAIIVLMVVTLIGVALRRQPSMPLNPTTIAFVLWYLSSSSIPDRVRNMPLLNENTRNQRVRDLNLRYGLFNKIESSSVAVATIEVEPSTS